MWHHDDLAREIEAWRAPLPETSVRDKQITLTLNMSLLSQDDEWSETLLTHQKENNAARQVATDIVDLKVKSNHKISHGFDGLLSVTIKYWKQAMWGQRRNST